MGAPLGSQNRANGKRFANALKTVLEEYADNGIKRGEALRAIAKGLVVDALAGDFNSRKEIADRLDGKPGQQVTIDGDGDGGPVKIERLERVIVRANATDSNG